MWALWNKEITVNTWRTKVDKLINQTCPLCGNEEESTLDRFWECWHASLALCVNLLTITSHHIWLTPYIGNNLFLLPKVQGKCNVWRTYGPC
jgi:hypothetical protein